METAVLAIALLAAAAALALAGALSLAGRLPRNRWFGIQAASVRADDARWQAGHRAAGGTLLAAAGPPLLLAVALAARPPDALADWFVIYAVVGAVTGGLVALAVRQADRAATELDGS